MTETSSIDRSLRRVGRAVGITFISDCYWVGIRTSLRFLFILEGRYSHHLPTEDGRFLGWHGEGGEPVLGLICPRAGDLNHLPGVSGHRSGSDGSGLLLEISRTTGGRSARGMWEVAVASGGSAPTSIATSGNEARGGV